MATQEKAAHEALVHIGAGAQVLQGDLVVPAGATAIVLFAHGSGSSRHSPRNQQVARTLNRAGLATLLFDLLTPAEAEGERSALRFDIELLAARLIAGTEWVAAEPATQALRIGYFGASTGAAAALVAAARRPRQVGAVVSRGGRPDLAAGALERVEAPTLLIVGGADDYVLELNRRAWRRLRVESDLSVVPGATHLFEEPGAMEEVASLASAWFTRHLHPAPRSAGV
jgi:dienelactone hydrolase